MTVVRPHVRPTGCPACCPTGTHAGTRVGTPDVRPTVSHVGACWVQNQSQIQSLLPNVFGLVFGYESIHRYGSRREGPPVLCAASAGDGWLGATR